MPTDRDNLSSVRDAELTMRAAWLYYEASLTQAEISEQLQIPPARVQRLIARAARDGLVRILIEGDLAGCVMLERALIERFGLIYCRVVPALPGTEPKSASSSQMISSLGRATAAFLRETFERDQHHVIGFGHGRTLAAAIDHLPREPRAGLNVISVVGGLAQRIDATPFDVIHALAEKTGAAAYLPPVPFYAQSEADRRVLLRQRGVAEAFSMAAAASLYVMGIGEIGATASLCRTAMLLPQELEQARLDGAVAEALGWFFDIDGRRIDTELHDRLIGIDLQEIKGREIVAVAGGVEKHTAIAAILRGRWISGLITDEETARQLVADA